MKYYIVKGPAEIGNIFGFFGHEVPEGYLAICYDGEYNNGGMGPIQAVKGLWRDKYESRTIVDGPVTIHESLGNPGSQAAQGALNALLEGYYDVPKTRRRVEDRLRKENPETILGVAERLGVSPAIRE